MMRVLEALQRPESPTEAKYAFIPGSTEKGTQARTGLSWFHIPRTHSVCEINTFSWILLFMRTLCHL